MMLQGRGGEERYYASIWDACRKIYRFEGVGGFFKGMVPTYLKVVPSVAISFGTYEVLKRVGGE
jgi:solute carrier family 25 phosphate transporter 23/24/25/41